MNKIIEIARTQIGYEEEDGNKTKYGKWFGMDGVAWCAIFISWCYDQAGLPLKDTQFKKGFAGCQYLYEYAKKNGWIVDIPQSGDLVVFDWNKDGRYDHVGLFDRPTEDQRFITIEGNTAIKNDSNGGQVMERIRKFGNCIFIHPKF